MTPVKKVFISYSRTDSERVAPLIEGIRRMRYDVWLDQELSGGQAWWNTILGHIRECDAILLAVSEKTMDSEACKEEFEYARALNKPILPVIVEHVAPTVLWSELAVIQLVDYTGPPGKAAFDLISALSQLPAAGDLPDPLPEPPPVPMSYLTELSHAVQARTLNLDEQLAVLGKLKARLQRPGDREVALQLIHKLRDRNDLFHTTAVEIGYVLGERPVATPDVVKPAPQAPPPQPTTYAPPQMPPAVPPVNRAATPGTFSGPPPNIPPPQVIRPAPQVAYPVPQQAPWVATSPPRSAGVPTWLIVVLLISAVLAALGAAIFVAQIFSGSGALGGSRQQLVAAVEFAIASSASVAALIGLMGGDRWGPVVGWVAVAALVITVVGIPFAAAVAWGLIRTPREAVAGASRPGGGLRIGSAAIGSVLLIAIVGSTAAYGWTHRQVTPGPVAKPTPTSTTCVLAQPDSLIMEASAGGLCGFRLGSPVVQFDCRSGKTLPVELVSASTDFSKGSPGVAATPSSDPCQLIAPTYKIESSLSSVDSLPAGDIVMVADVSPAQPVQLLDVALFYGCDSKGCIEADVYTPDGSLNVYSDTTNLISQHVDLRTGSNRLMMEVHQQDITVWLNGQQLAPQKAGRLHGAGKYWLTMESLDKSGSVRMDIIQFAVFHLA